MGFLQKSALKVFENSFYFSMISIGNMSKAILSLKCGFLLDFFNFQGSIMQIWVFSPNCNFCSRSQNYVFLRLEFYVVNWFHMVYDCLVPVHEWVKHFADKSNTGGTIALQFFSINGAENRVIKHNTVQFYEETHYGQKLPKKTLSEEFKPVVIESYEFANP